ncbi:YceD family protein [Fischerella thermalis]|uniref:Metal-binding protein n=1 Tax=Fischerella thermalis CCMEE 5318 TaxID=2019666 RepID=A0A2N6L844_9CYAN|nr:YceD family protein [Fischerella thermalis]PMB18331.1 metal-binding protein [Fischerella thermalis CCMEE 5318]
MDAIYIPQLTKAPERTEEIQVKEFLSGLDTLTPVRGRIRVQHCGNYLEVSGQAETIITCTCNRCLQNYNYRLVVDTSEIIWLDETVEQEVFLPLEREIAVEDLVETLSPHGYFDPGEWLYEQVCLEIPQRQLCDTNCPGIQPSHDPASTSAVDRRWASLEALKKQLPS